MATVGAYVLSAVGVTGASATVTYAVGVAVVATVSAVALSAALDDKLKGLGKGGDSRGLTNQIDPIGDFDLVYGETRKGGVITYAEVSSDNKYLHRFLVLAGHEVDSIGDIYIQDEIVSFASGSEGYVTTGAGGTDWDQKIYIKKFTGSATQDIYTDLQGLTNKPTDITSSFKGKGIACLYIRMEYDADTFSGGIPLFTAKVRGKKVYDPRKDSTSSAYQSSLGVSTHRTNNPSTWQFSDEPALAIRDYLTSDFGVGAEQTSIDDDMIATAIAACASTGVSGVEENSFKINGTVTTGGTPQQNLNAFMTTLNGTLFYGQGEWRLLAGAYTTPDASVSGANSFGYDDIVSDIGIATRFSRRDTVNTVRGTFIDGSSDGRFIATDYPEQQIPSLSEDNGQESVLDLTLPLTTNSATAQRLAKQVLFVGREQISISAAFTLEKAFAVQVGDTIELTLDRYGWTQKQFKVMGWKMSGLDGSNPVVNLNLQETSSTVYQWSVSADEYQAITHNNTSLGDNTAGLAITNLSTTLASTLQTDGTAMSRVILSWNAVSNAQIRHYEVQWKPSSLSNYSSTIAPNNSIEIEPLTAGTTYNFRVRAITVNDNAGAYATINATAVTDTTAPSTPSAPTITAGVKQLEISWQGYSFPSDFASMEVHHSTSSSGTYSLIGTSAGTSLVHGGLTQNTTHYYKLKAKDFSGNISGFSAIGNGTVAADVQGPAGPSGLIVTLNGAEIQTNNVDPQTATQAQLDAAFLAANPLLSQMSDVPEDAVVWARFINPTFTNATSMSSGTSYVIEALGSTDFTLVGASRNLVGIQFTATGAGTGTGKVTTVSARKWDYSSQDWSAHAQTFDSPAIFSPTVFALETFSQFIAATEIVSDKLKVNSEVNLEDGAAWKVGKSTYDEQTNGIFFGNPTGNLDFAFSTFGQDGSGDDHGVSFSDTQTRITNPIIEKDAVSTVSSANISSTQTIVIKSSSVNPNAVSLTVNSVGGGAGGAASVQTTSPTSGGRTRYRLIFNGTNQSYVNATGGIADAGTGVDKWRGDDGQDSAFASGGAGGSSENDTGDAGTLGSGGGGGAGNPPDWNQSSVKGGAGGGAGVHVTNTYDISSYSTVSIEIAEIGNVTNTSEGNKGVGSRGDGGDGGNGVVKYTIETSGSEPVVLNTQPDLNAMFSSTNGSFNHPSGFQVRFGSFSNATDDDQTVTFGADFSTKCLGAVCSVGGATFLDASNSINKNRFVFNRINDFSGTYTVYYIAFGN